jgi:pimeloyl-ACP methyl ester carboxylesterase
VKRVRQLLAAFIVVLAANLGHLPTDAAGAPDEALGKPGPCLTGSLAGGALSMFCVPSRGWNGDLLVYAHGYVAYNAPLDFYNLTFSGIYVPTLVQYLGYAFATTSYRSNGLVILDGEDDIRQLVSAFPGATGKTAAHTYLVGVSEGGLIATLLTEQSPQLFSGTLAGCGPIGSFQNQIEYLGNVRVLFDYFFPNVLPPSPISIPQSVIDGWDSTYDPAVTSAVQANPVAAQQLIAVSHAPIDPSDFTHSVVTTTTGILWYNVFGTNDARSKLGGNPYTNKHFTYHGSTNDTALNQNVERFSADPVALANVAPYETTGNVTIPLVTLHDTGDPIIPFWHETLYTPKIHTSGNGIVTQIPVKAYGHCNFTIAQLLGAFKLVVKQSTATREWQSSPGHVRSVDTSGA